MDILNIDATFVIGACVGITQKHGAIDKEKFGVVMTELFALEGGYITADMPAASSVVSKFRDGWKRGFPEKWLIA